MNYLEEAKSLLREIVWESWMDEEDYEAIVKEMFEKTNGSYEELAKDIETGVNNGFSIQQQKDICKFMLNLNKI